MLMYFRKFRYYLPWKGAEALHLNEFQSHSTKDALCQVWLKFAQWFWRTFLNVNAFYYYLPLEKGMILHLNKL